MESSTEHPKLFGRAFYESLGSPKVILAPMVDQSEFAWRMLTRSFMKPEKSRDLLAYTPMFHARLFHETANVRDTHFNPIRNGLRRKLSPPTDPKEIYLDGNPIIDRPLFVQFCANDPDDLLQAAEYVAPFCDAVDLNLGCPQGIAKRGNYGAFLQEDWQLIHSLISNLHNNLPIPVTAKFRIQETAEKTLEYAKMILSAGASIITVHGRQRHQKGHETGLADWSVIRYLREHLPKETVIFANGNILQHSDIARCLQETGADGVMSAEGNLNDPAIFSEPPPAGEEGREYWRGKDGKGGYRMDAIFRRYLDVIYKYVLEKEPPPRKPLFIPSDLPSPPQDTSSVSAAPDTSALAESEEPPRKRARQSKKATRCTDPNLVAMQSHLFSLLRPLASKHHNVRDALARTRAGNIDSFEQVLSLAEEAIKEGLLEYKEHSEGFEEKDSEENNQAEGTTTTADKEEESEMESSKAAVRRCRRPFWVCQPYVRPMPKEALEKGSLTLSKKDKAKLAAAEATAAIAAAGVTGKTKKDDTVQEVANNAVTEKIDATTTVDVGDNRDKMKRELLVAG
ncbi:MAG: hypothetical protein M1834_007465 [Cirrosporium novae-zelandiae]|nr:MAG: hypothetical protein M1834_007465 [Cirrosporium novae-zelandiae]